MWDGEERLTRLMVPSGQSQPQGSKGSDKDEDMGEEQEVGGKGVPGGGNGRDYTVERARATQVLQGWGGRHPPVCPGPRRNPAWVAVGGVSSLWPRRGLSILCGVSTVSGVMGVWACRLLHSLGVPPSRWARLPRPLAPR